MKFSVTWNKLLMIDEELVTSGSVNTVTAEFIFDNSWEGYDRIAVFKNGEEAREVVLESDRCVIPWEVLRRSGFLTVGVYGVQGERRLPTIYSKPLAVSQGAGAALPGQAPTPSPYSQLKKLIGDLSQLRTEDQTNLVAALNEILTGGSGDSAADEEFTELLEDIFGPGGTGSGGGAGQENPGNPGGTADPDNPDKESGAVASDKEVEDMLDDIFG